jgi:phage gp29-like protein
MASTKKLPADLKEVFASTADGRDITRPFTRGLEEPKDARLLGAVDWGVYDRIRKDDQVKSTMEQRIAAVVSRDWDVLPGDDEDPRAVEAADAFKLVLEAASIDEVQKKMLWATFYGYQVAEVIWLPGRDRIDFRLRVRHGRRFRFTSDGQLRLITLGKPQGEAVPDRKFWVATSGATDDDAWYGEGLADWLYWPVTFKRNGLRFWNKFLDKFSVPTAVGKYRSGTALPEIEKLLAALQAVANDTGIAIPDSAAIELLNVANAGPDFEKMPHYMDAAISKIVLSQTMTTDDGSSLAQGKVHAGVKMEVIKADADTQSDSFNATVARWWTDLNYGPDVACPRFVRIVEEEQDLKVQAETDKTLSELGWRRNEDSFRDTYGDGYDYTPPAKLPDQLAGAGKKDRAAEPVNDNADGRAAASFAEGEGDIVDAIAAQLVDQGLTPLGPMIMPIVAAIEAANSPEELESKLIQSLDQSQVDQLVEQLARAGFSLRIAAEAGADTLDG